MGLDDIIRTGVAIASSVTRSLHVDVKHRQWIGSADTGPRFDPTPRYRKCLLEMKPRLVRDEEGREVTSQSKLTFLDPIPAHGAAGRREPLDPRDELTLPNGVVGPILSIAGLDDPEADGAYLFEVYLG